MYGSVSDGLQYCLCLVLQSLLCCIQECFFDVVKPFFGQVNLSPDVGPDVIDRLSSKVQIVNSLKPKKHLTWEAWIVLRWYVYFLPGFYHGIQHHQASIWEIKAGPLNMMYSLGCIGQSFSTHMCGRLSPSHHGGVFTYKLPNCQMGPELFSGTD